MNATFNATSPDAVDYDISTASGWLPDFRDPSTYLSIVNPDDGEMMTSMGLETGLDKNKEAKEAGQLFKYYELYEKACKETSDIEKRNELFAEAEAVLLKNVLLLPINLEAAVPRVTKAVPFSGPFAFAGPTDARFKYLRIQDKPVTIEQYETLKKEWEGKRDEALQKMAKEEEEKQGKKADKDTKEKSEKADKEEADTDDEKKGGDDDKKK